MTLPTQPTLAAVHSHRMPVTSPETSRTDRGSARKTPVADRPAELPEPHWQASIESATD
jgi:hypothetical protein